MSDIAGRLSESWQWLAHSDAGLWCRIGFGVVFFGALAASDLARNGKRATRWREYLFLVGVVCVTLLYGVLNDEITSRISWEYFYYGKDLAAVLGTKTPPDPARLSWEAAKVGLKATWTVGLLIGVAMLVANNPRAGRAQLSYGRLMKRMPMIGVAAMVFAALLGAVGWRGGLVGTSDDFREMVRRDEFRPFRFMAVYGVHLGGYVGGLLGTVWAVLSVRRARLVRLRAGGATKDTENTEIGTEKMQGRE